MESTRISDALRDYRKGFRPLLGWLGSLGRFELFVAVIVVGAVVTSFFAAPRMSIAGSPLEPLVEELGEDASPPGVRISTPTPSVEGLGAPPQPPIIETPDGQRYFTIARTVRRVAASEDAPDDGELAIGLGCELKHARRLTYA